MKATVAEWSAKSVDMCFVLCVSGTLSCTFADVNTEHCYRNSGPGASTSLRTSTRATYSTKPTLRNCLVLGRLRLRHRPRRCVLNSCGVAGAQRARRPRRLPVPPRDAGSQPRLAQPSRLVILHHSLYGSSCLTSVSVYLFKLFLLLESFPAPLRRLSRCQRQAGQYRW